MGDGEGKGVGEGDGERGEGEGKGVGEAFGDGEGEGEEGAGEGLTVGLEGGFGEGLGLAGGVDGLGEETGLHNQRPVAPLGLVVPAGHCWQPVLFLTGPPGENVPGVHSLHKLPANPARQAAHVVLGVGSGSVVLPGPQALQEDLAKGPPGDTLPGKHCVHAGRFRTRM